MPGAWHESCGVRTVCMLGCQACTLSVARGRAGGALRLGQAVAAVGAITLAEAHAGRRRERRARRPSAAGATSFSQRCSRASLVERGSTCSMLAAAGVIADPGREGERSWRCSLTTDLLPQLDELEHYLANSKQLAAQDRHLVTHALGGRRSPNLRALHMWHGLDAPAPMPGNRPDAPIQGIEDGPALRGTWSPSSP